MKIIVLEIAKASYFKPNYFKKPFLKCKITEQCFPSDMTLKDSMRWNLFGAIAK